MRKLFLTAAAVLLISSAANAGQSRGLSLASNEPPAQTAAQPKAAEKPVEQTKATETPAQAKTGDVKPVDVKPTVEKSKRKAVSTEARVVYELHRHGIYW